MHYLDQQKIVAQVVAAKNGQEEGFEYLWNFFAPRVKSYIFCRINQKNDVDDLVSEIFIRAFSKINSFDLAKATFSTWIFSITKNVLIDYYGSVSHQIKWLDLEALTQLENNAQSIFHQFEYTLEELEKKADSKENLIQNIETLLEELPSQYAELIRLKYLFGFDNKQIAEATSKTPGNIRVALHRALSQAQKALRRMNF